MGKGDRKSKKGKISIGSYGVSRNRKTLKARPSASPSVSKASEEVPAKPKRTTRKKAD